MLPVIMFGVFFLLLGLGMPIAFAIGVGALVSLLYTGGSLSVLVQRVMTILDSFPFLAIPFFLLAGAIMESGGVSIRLIRLASVLVGQFRGGLALVSIVSTTIFSDVSGSKAADTAAIGSVTLPAMRQAGYPMDLATAFVAAGGAAAVLIPPCITMVIYGFITDTSIAALFLAGFMPGLLMSFATLVLAYFMCRRRKLPAGDAPTRAEAFSAFVGALLPLGMPIVILGGIVGGIFTITEAAAVAVIYGLVISLAVTRFGRQPVVNYPLRTLIGSLRWTHWSARTHCRSLNDNLLASLGRQEESGWSSCGTHQAARQSATPDPKTNAP